MGLKKIGSRGLDEAIMKELTLEIFRMDMQKIRSWLYDL